MVVIQKIYGSRGLKVRQQSILFRTRVLDFVFIGTIVALNVVLFLVRFPSLIEEMCMDDVPYYGYWLILGRNLPTDPPAFYMLGFTLLEITSLKWWFFVKVFRIIIAVLGSYYIYQILKHLSVNQAISFFSSIFFTINYYHVTFAAEILKNVLAQLFALILIWSIVSNIYSKKRRILAFVFLICILTSHLITALWVIAVLILWFLLWTKGSEISNKLGLYILIGLSISFIILVPYIRATAISLELSGASSFLPTFFSAVVGRLLIGYLESGYGAPFIVLSLASALIIYFIIKTEYFGNFAKKCLIIAYFLSVCILMIPYLYFSTLSNEIYFNSVRHTQINFVGYLIRIPNYIFIISLTTIILLILGLFSFKQNGSEFVRTKVIFAVFLYFFSLTLSVAIWRSDSLPLIYVYSFLFFFAYIFGYYAISKYNEINEKIIFLIALMIVLGILRSSEYVGFGFDPHYWYRFEYESIIPFIFCSAMGMNFIFSNKQIDNLSFSPLLKGFFSQLERFANDSKWSITAQLLLMNFILYTNIGLTNAWLGMRFSQSNYYTSEVITATHDLLYFSTSDSIIVGTGPVVNIRALTGHNAFLYAHYLNKTDSYSLAQFLMKENVTYVIIDWNAETYTRYYPPEFTKNYAKLNSQYFIKVIDCGKIETYAVIFT